jgi:hypothetical protein
MYPSIYSSSSPPSLSYSHTNSLPHTCICAASRTLIHHCGTLIFLKWQPQPGDAGTLGGTYGGGQSAESEGAWGQQGGAPESGGWGGDKMAGDEKVWEEGQEVWKGDQGVGGEGASSAWQTVKDIASAVTGIDFD